MVWPFSSDNNGSAKQQQDLVKNLDPELRRFLEKESPLKYTLATASDTKPAADAFPSLQTSKEPPDHDQAEKPRPPSLFKDGRYDHLWKTYKPQSELEASVKTPEERLSDVLGAYKERKAAIGAAALENCAIQQWEQHDCFRNGGFTKKMTSCGAETKALERCYTMNAKFLKALGYLSVMGRSDEEEEKIQMHADKLYRRMIEREDEEKKARMEGKPLPDFKPILDDGTGQTLDIDWRGVNPQTKEDFEKRMEKLGSVEREVEKRAMMKEIEAGRQARGIIDDVWKEDRRAREERKEKGQTTLSDVFWTLLGR